VPAFHSFDLAGQLSAHGDGLARRIATSDYADAQAECVMQPILLSSDTQIRRGDDRRRRHSENARRSGSDVAFLSGPRKRLARLDIAELGGDNVSSRMRTYSNDDCQ